MITIYHNPRCSKSRQTLALLKSKGIEPQIILYLDNPPNKPTLIQLLEKLSISAQQLVRKSEAEFKLNFTDQEMTENDYVEAMLRFPKLIERPIVEAENRAVIGRPPENVLDIIV
jgi:arsenate reductase